MKETEKRERKRDFIYLRCQFVIFHYVYSKLALEQAMKAQRDSRGIPLLFL